MLSPIQSRPLSAAGTMPVADRCRQEAAAEGQARFGSRQSEERAVFEWALLQALVCRRAGAAAAQAIPAPDACPVWSCNARTGRRLGRQYAAASRTRLADQIALALYSGELVSPSCTDCLTAA